MSQKPLEYFSIFLENNLATQGAAKAFHYEKPVEIISVCNPLKVDEALVKMEQALKEGFHLAGWISYEAGLCMEGKLAGFAEKSEKIPLIHMGVFSARKPLSVADAEEYWHPSFERAQFESNDFRLNVEFEAYEKALAAIQAYLKAGDIYQVNYTLKAQFGFKGYPEDLYASLRKAQRVEFGAFMQTDQLSVLSLSPELFFRKEADRITAKPMKGTCARGRDLEEDQKNAAEMQQDEKSRAENLMIVDLLRNDLSKIALPGSVEVKSLFDVERYRTLFQMTSTIQARVTDIVGPVDIIRAIFPCGSITGAPKIRAMEIIDKLEMDRRGIYTGAIGFMTPEGDACFSVPIRTLVVDQLGQGEMGIGSAIIADSRADREYEECILKARFAAQDFPEFDLIETMLFRPEQGYEHLEAHMERLRASAEYFSFQCDEQEIRQLLQDQQEYLRGHKYAQSNWKCRLLLSASGAVSITSEPLDKTSMVQKKTITLSDQPVDSQNPMLYHKTSERTFYQRELCRARERSECFDVIFLNEDGALTEGSFTNIFIEKGGILYTPPVKAGLLNGILRQSLLKEGVQESMLYADDLHQADRIYVGNSVRGLLEVTLVP